MKCSGVLFPLALVAALVAGCSGGSGDKPSSLPTLTGPPPSASPAAVPEAAKAKTALGADAFVRFYFEQLNVAFRTSSPGTLLGLQCRRLYDMQQLREGAGGESAGGPLSRCRHLRCFRGCRSPRAGPRLVSRGIWDHTISAPGRCFGKDSPVVTRGRSVSLSSRNCSGPTGYGLAPTAGIQGCPVNRSRRTVIELWPCLRAVPR
jgi:hypothetical protein